MDEIRPGESIRMMDMNNYDFCEFVYLENDYWITIFKENSMPLGHSLYKYNGERLNTDMIAEYMGKAIKLNAQQEKWEAFSATRRGFFVRLASPVSVAMIATLLNVTKEKARELFSDLLIAIEP